MGELNRQEICAALGVRESVIRRSEQRRLPYTRWASGRIATTWQSARRG